MLETQTREPAEASGLAPGIIRRRRPMNARILAGLAAAELVTIRPLDASGVNGIAVEVGDSKSSRCEVTLSRVSLQKQVDAIRVRGKHGNLVCYWDLSMGCWKNDSFSRSHSRLMDVGLTPVVRLEASDRSSPTPYLEAGIGAHVLSHASVNAFRRFGSSFQFGDHLGVGIRCGENGRYDISYRLQHLSNGGIQSPNRGINYNVLRVGLHF